MLNTGTIIYQKYRILKVIGKGGMSVVYLGEDIHTGQQYAIKNVERNGLDEKNNVVMQSIATEAQTLRQLSNQHLPRIYDILEEENSFMLVMDYIDGISLDKVIKKCGAEPERLVYDWGIQICDVLDYLHNQTPPIIYRDMKPSNVILQRNGNLVLIDFGTARTQKENDMSCDTILVGTAGFAAPEQYGGIGQSDARTDIYCLGATLYNLITGHSPCDPPKGIQPLETFEPALAASPFNVIIRNCTHYKKEYRYQTAAELRNVLMNARDGRDGNLQPQKVESAAPWVRQKLKRTGEETAALSGLLPRRYSNPAKQEKKVTGVHPVQSGTVPPAPQVPEKTAVQTDRLGWNLMIALVVAAVVFLAISAAFVFLGGQIPAIAALCLAGVSILSAGFSLWRFYRAAKQEKP